jgi:phosphohistidine phosphatase
VQLILWRHADAYNGAPDQARALSPLGRTQARDMAAWLKPRLPADMRILVSPAVRTRQTADALEIPYDVVPGLYNPVNGDAVLDAAGWPDATSPVLIVGHQPVLGEAAARLLTSQPLSWHIDKACLWWFAGEAGFAQLFAVMGPDLL